MTLSFSNPLALLALGLIPVLLLIPLIGRGVRGQTRQFWAALALRALVLSGLILGLAGAQLVEPVQNTTVVFVVDHSDSVSAAEQARAEQFMRDAVAKLHSGDRAAVVVFGENALVERLASEENTMTALTSIPRAARTNVAAALRLALALLPDDANKRIVILSDGLENAGRALTLSDLAAARKVQIDYVPLNVPAGQAEAYVDALDAPANVRQGQAFEIGVKVVSTSAGNATVRLLGDGKLIESRPVTLQAGDNRFAFTLKAEDAGFKRYTAELDAAQDTLPQNNFAAAFTVVQGPPRVLVVENTGGEADNLIAALQSAKVESERIKPSALPGELAALANYDAVFLVNVPADALPDAATRNLPAYVRDLGRGLVMVGGANAYGAGGYLRTPLEAALPVDMDVQSRTQEPNLALAFVIDKSGSMGKCHCNDPNAAPGSYPQVESGLAKVEIAKDAIIQASRAVGRADYIGVVVFDANAHWAMRMQTFTDADAVQEKIGGIRAEGQTNIFAGLSEAKDALKDVPARFKHVILLTDGWSRSGQYDALTAEMKQDNITLSVVAAGGGSAEYLQGLARSGGGQYFAAPTMSDVPALFFKETVRATGSYIIEEAFQPGPGSATPILKGLDVTQLPALRGYNGATPKATARVNLLTARGDPLLATWQYGLGRSAAWTSDLKGQWASDWVKWGGFNTFVAQLTNWVLPQPNDTGLQTEFASDGEQTLLRVTSQDANGQPRDLLETQAQIVNPDGTTQTVTLAQSAPGEYRAPLTAAQSGIYLAQVTQRDSYGNPAASATTGLVVPYSPEYKFADASASVLPALARATTGKELSDPAQVFEPFAEPAARTQPIWMWLLLLAALLFVLDVAVRRLRLKGTDAARVRAWLRVPAAAGASANARSATQEPRVLEGLFAARSRAKMRTQTTEQETSSGHEGTSATTGGGGTPTPQQGAGTVGESAPRADGTGGADPEKATATKTDAGAAAGDVLAEAGTDEDMTTRLKKARDRARKGR